MTLKIDFLEVLGFARFVKGVAACRREAKLSIALYPCIRFLRLLWVRSGHKRFWRVRGREADTFVEDRMDIETIVEDKMPKTGINLYWFTAIAVLVVWPFFFFVAIEGLRGSSLSIFKSSAHAYGYQLAILLILFAPFAPLSIAISRTKERKWILIGIAILLLVYHVMGALFNFWVSDCYGFGRGCI